MTDDDFLRAILAQPASYLGAIALKIGISVRSLAISRRKTSTGPAMKNRSRCV